MADTGWKNPATAGQDSNTGQNNWSNPDAIKVEDGITAGWSGPKFDGNDVEDGPSLKASNFSFAVPVGATITGIETKIIGSGSHAGESAYLMLLGSPSTFPYGIEKKDYWAPAGVLGFNPPFVWGSSNDLWGTYDLTPELVNQTNFGWTYMIYDSSNPLSSGIDSMQMKIYYDLPQTAGMMGAGF